MPCCPQACPIVPKPAPHAVGTKKGMRQGGIRHRTGTKEQLEGLVGGDYRAGEIIWDDIWGRQGGHILGKKPPCLSPPRFAFQSPKRSSASGSAPRDSTRRVRRVWGNPPRRNPARLDFWGGGALPPEGKGVSRLVPSPASCFLPLC